MTVEESAPFFEWFVSFGNLLTIGISIATLSVFIWRFAKYLRKEMKKDAEAIRNSAIEEISKVDRNVSILTDKVVDNKTQIDEKIDNMLTLTQKTNDKLETIGQHTNDIKIQVVKNMANIDVLKEHVNTIQEDLDEHIKWGEGVAEWGKEIASKLEKEDLVQKLRLRNVLSTKKEEEDDDDDNNNILP